MARDRVIDVLTAFGKSIVKLYKVKVREKDVMGRSSVASSTLADTAKFIDVRESGTGTGKYTVTINLQEYWKFVEDGRSSGFWPPVDAINEWISNKPELLIPKPYTLPSGKEVIPTQDQIAYLIGRKIFNDGIAPKPMLLESIHELDGELTLQLAEAIHLDVEDGIREEIKNS